MDAWTSRGLTVAQAADLIGITRNHLDQIVKTIGPMADLVSAKHRHRRYFSRRDIAVLRIAYAMERFGTTWLFAMSDAIEAVDAGVRGDQHLVIQCNRSLPRAKRSITDRDIERLQIEQPTLLVPAGRIVEECRA